MQRTVACLAACTGTTCRHERTSLLYHTLRNTICVFIRRITKVRAVASTYTYTPTHKHACRLFRKNTSLSRNCEVLSVCFKGVCVYLNLRCVSVMCEIVDSTSCPSALITHMSHSVSKCCLVGACGYLSFNFPWLHNNHNKLFVCLFVNLLNFYLSIYFYLYRLL